MTEYILRESGLKEDGHDFKSKEEISIICAMLMTLQTVLIKVKEHREKNKIKILKDQLIAIGRITTIRINKMKISKRDAFHL